MANIRKLSQFRQLSLSGDTPPSSHRRKSLKKQISEDIPDVTERWLETGHEIRVSVNAKNKKNLDKPQIKIAWTDKPQEVCDDAVIIKKCKEVRRLPSGKLTRHASLEKDSILYSKQDLAERLRSSNVAKEKTEEKPNLKIFLAHNTRETDVDIYNNSQSESNEPQQYLEKSYDKPKIIQPLLNIDEKNLLIRKNRTKLNTNESDNASKLNIIRSNTSKTLVVVPIIEKVNETRITKDLTSQRASPLSPTILPLEENNDEMKAINNIIIRPSTAASRREKFQKRTSSAFHSTVRDSPTPGNPRPILIRSSSAPSKSDKGKFLATKRKIKASKRVHAKPSHHQNTDDEDSSEFSNKENPKLQKEWRIGNEIVTMVSLISPTGSDVEDGPEEENSAKKAGSKEKVVEERKKEEKEIPKNLSLRKTVKSVSFQQSSIHAIRSFSASFPARRGSMATALLGNGKTPSQGTKTTQEKRGTNATSPDADERVPKRRLVRSNTEEPKTISYNTSESTTKSSKDDTAKAANSNIVVEVKSKTVPSTDTNKLENLGNNNAKSRNGGKAENTSSIISDEESKSEEPTYKTPKEKQCWDMYCKMTEKGISVSYDTILRGMLTPTEYRMRRKSSICLSDLTSTTSSEDQV